MPILNQNHIGHQPSSFKQMKLSNKILSSLIIIICLNSCVLSSSLVILPFHYINSKTNTSSPITTTPRDYFESFLKHSLYTTIKINNKPLNFHLTLDRHTTYISEKTLQEIDPKSAEIKEDEDLYSLEYIGILRAKYTKSSFSFFTNNTQNITTNNYSFFMMRKRTDDSDYIINLKYLATEDTEIGLNVYKGNKREKVDVEEDDPFDPYYDEEDDSDKEDEEYPFGPYDSEEDEDNEEKKRKIKLGEKYVNKNNGYLIEQNTNLITQLKKNNYISSYAFMITYDNKNEEKGKITIGGLPHEYDPRHYSQKYFIYNKAFFGNGYGNWGFTFQDIIYNGIKYVSLKGAEISLDFGFILAMNNFRELLNEQFFQKEGIVNYCNEEQIDSYYVKYCEENVIKDFKTISFVLSDKFSDYNQSNILEFDYKDLFVKAPGDNNLYYFQIVFKDGFDNWKLGRPLFKKYPTIFDQDKKIFGFYKEKGEYNIEENDTNGGGLSLAWIMVIILAICLIVLGFAFVKVLPYIKRNKRANELDDEYDYVTGISMKKEDNKNFINGSVN